MYKPYLMRFSIFFLILMLIVGLPAKSQYYFYNDNYFEKPLLLEAGISAGALNNLTDVGGGRGLGKKGLKDLNLRNTTFAGGFYFGALYNHFLGLRLEGVFGRARSNDSLLAGVKNSAAIGRYNRNLSFRTPISEFSLIAEFHPVEFFKVYDPEKFASDFSPYILGGAGFFHFNPQTNLNGEWISLHPLHTEGQGFIEYSDSREYSLNQVNLSYGVGLQYELSARLNLRLEYMYRILFTDYLDDVHGRYIDPSVFSKYLSGTYLDYALILNNRGRMAPASQTTAHPGGIRGNPNNDDAYFTVMLKVGYVIGRPSTTSVNKKFLRSQRSPVRF